ncbi:MAG TPA: hypothetical protein H9951_15155 [Candidatus Bacteroides intestinigallinarum]|nr:hypothetical protein [Candidatus Bacteroides intestinigallinarum]
MNLNQIMENTYFILSNTPVIIDRLHICTWDFKGGTEGAIEIGLEFSHDFDSSKDIKFALALPFLNENDKVECLMPQLILSENSRFIFNDKIMSIEPIKGNERYGATLKFENRNPLKVIPLKGIEQRKGLFSFTAKSISAGQRHYIRFYIKKAMKDFATIKRGIAKTSFIYDIKINERRNLPDYLNELLDNKQMEICGNIKQGFCFHVIPSSFNIAYLNSENLKNIRILESDAFNRYLNPKRPLKNNEYIIIFNKITHTNNSSYTFFSIFEKEIIGNKQILLAIGANILCSLLLEAYSLYTANPKWYIPFGIFSTILIIAYLLSQTKSFKR